MNTRIKFSMVLLCFGLILALLPLSANRSFTAKPQDLLSEVLNEKSFFTVDQVARFVVSEDSTVRIVDLRTPDEFRKKNIPGSINIPYNNFLDTDPQNYFTNKNIKTIFYSNGDFDANYAYTIARGFKYSNVYVMKGGLSEWDKTIVNSSFKGDRISARENALFETRLRARILYNELNNLPDSLKLKHIELKHYESKKLDGGC